MRTTVANKEKLAEHHTHSESRLQLILSVITLLLVIGNYFATYYIYMSIEYAKVGGKENFGIISQVQKKQVEAVIDYYKKNPTLLNDGVQQAPGVQKEPNTPMKTSIALSSIASLKEGSDILGELGAPLTWIEYSDLECPYCKQFKDSNIYENISKKYSGKIHYMFKHFPLNIHPGSEKKHELLECMRKEKGSTAYFSLKDTIFDENGFDTPINFDKALELAQKLGGGKETLSTCVEEGRYKEKIRSSILDGQNYFEISGTPSTIIINNTTGEYKAVHGMTGEAEYENAIKSLLGQ